MTDRKLPELNTRIRLDTGDLDRAEGRFKRFLRTVESGDGFGRYEGQLERLSAKADEFGSKATRNLTLPIVAAGAVASKLALDFNTTFSQMQSLAGVASGEVAGLREEVLTLSGETARAPQELAEALYFIRSAGLEGSAAVGALEVSAQAAALGLGETKVVADAVTSAMNAYASSNLSAAEAADILAAAVEQGKGEAAALAPQLGQLLPLANLLGVGFDEVAGSVAFFTRTGAPAAQAATQLSGILAKLVRPSQLGQETLAKYGLTIDELKKVVADQGLLPALQLLFDRLGGNEQELAKVFEDIEGLRGALALLADNGAPAAEVLDRVANSTGLVAEKLAALQQTDEFKFQQALVELQRLGVEVGQDLIPVLAELGETVSGLVGIFDALPGPVKQGLLLMVALAAVAGPVAKGVSLAASGVGALLKVASSASLDSFRLGLMGVGGAGADASAKLGLLIRTMGPAGLGAAAGGLAILTAAFVQMSVESERAKRNAQSLREELERGTSAYEAVADKLANTIAGADGGFENLRGSSEKFREDLERYGVSVEEFTAALTGSEDEWESFRSSLLDENRGNSNFLEFFLLNIGRMRSAVEEARGSEEVRTEALRRMGVETDDLSGSTDVATSSMIDFAGATGEASDELAEAADNARSLFDLGRNFDRATEGVADAERELAEARREASTEGKEYARAQEQIANAERAVQDAQVDSQRAQEALNDARVQAKERLEDLRIAAQQASASELSAEVALDRARSDALKARTTLDKREAQARITEAEAALAAAREQKGDATDELAEAERRGIERSDEVIAAQERITEARDRETAAQKQLADATESAAEVRRKAQERVKEASDRLTEAQLTQIDAIADLVEATDGSSAAHEVLLGLLGGLEQKLAPDSPLRKRIREYAADLAEIVRLAGVAELAPYSTGGTGIPGFRYPDQMPSAPSGPRSLTNPAAIAPPAGSNRLPAPAAVGGNGVTVTNTFQVSGQPDGQTIALLEDVATRATERAIRQAGVN